LAADRCTRSCRLLRVDRVIPHMPEPPIFESRLSTSGQPWYEKSKSHAHHLRDKDERDEHFGELLHAEGVHAAMLLPDLLCIELKVLEVVAVFA
jgi:hypothetical protein